MNMSFPNRLGCEHLPLADDLEELHHIDLSPDP